MSKPAIRVSIVIPVYRGETTLPTLIEKIRSLVAEQSTPDGLKYVICESILVHDCGPDRSDLVLEEISASCPFVRVVWLSRNYGQHAATMAGMASASGDWVVTLDADGQHLPAEIPRLLALAPESDLVLGTRDHLFAEMSSVRRSSNRLSSRAISWAAGQTLSDVQTGFRYYSRRLIERLGGMRGRFEAESVVVVRSVRAGLCVRTTPIRLGRADGRSTSHYRPVIDSTRIAVAVARARLGPMA